MSTEPESLLALIGAQMDAAMSKLEVRLIDRFAGKKDLEDLDKRVVELEKVNDGRVAVSGLWRMIFGGLGAAVIGSVVYIVGFHIH